MAKLKEIIQYSKANPESEYAKQAFQHIQSGAFDEQSQKEGIDLSVFGRPKLEKKESGLSKFATGVGKGVVETVKGAGQAGEKIARAILPKSMESPSVYSEEALQADKAKGGFTGKLLNKDNLEGKNSAEKFGKGVEEVAEYLLPAGKISKTSNAIDALITGGGFLKGAARILAKGGVEGVANAMITGVKTGGDAKAMGRTALIAGGTKSALSGIGELANAAKLPERLYSTIFKNSSDDMLQELRTGALDKWQKTNPKEFASLVEKGIIKTGADGKVALNETLAKEALDRGLKGSLRNMATESVKNTYRLEDQAKEVVKNYKGTITGKPVMIAVPEKDKLVSLLDEVATDYTNVGGSMSDDAAKLSTKLKADNLDAESALELRRFLDGMRVRSSFNPGQKLSQTQANFKHFADATRSELSKIPGMKSIMNEYRFNIEALETIAKEAAKQGNSQLLSLIDSMLLSGGIAAASPAVGFGSIVARRALKNAPILTKGANAIKDLGKSSRGGTAVRGLISQ